MKIRTQFKCLCLSGELDYCVDYDLPFHDPMAQENVNPVLSIYFCQSLGLMITC